MKWYYKWKLNRIQAEMSSIKKSIDLPLIDNYTGYSRLRSLSRIAVRLEERLAKYPSGSPRDQAASSP